MGLCERQECSDARAHRIAHHVGAANTEMVEQRPHVVGHQVGCVERRIVELGRRAMAAAIKREHPPAGTHQGRHPARIDPVDLLGGGKAMHQHDRLAFALVEERDLHGPVPETARGIGLVHWHDPGK